MVHRAFIMADDVIDAPYLPRELGVLPIVDGNFLNVGVGMKIAEVERRLILATLKHCDGSKEKTAEMLGVSVKTLYNRLREYGAQ
jgi:DNA-binding NtrC family response regulator